MIQVFSPLTEVPAGDLQLVDQIGAIDLRLAYETGIVEGSLDSVEAATNGIEDPSSIIGRPDDVFSLSRASEFYSDAAASAVPSAAVSNGSPDSGAPSSE